MNHRSRSYLMALAACLACGAAFAQGAKVGDATAVATVNGDPITRKALVDHTLTYVGKQCIEQLVDRSITRQEAARLKVTVPAPDLEKRFTEAQAQAGYQEGLKAEEITADAFRDRLKYGMLAERIRDAKWPIKNSDLVRFSVQYARLQSETVARDFIRDYKNQPNKEQAWEFLVIQRSVDAQQGDRPKPDPFFRWQNAPFFNVTMAAVNDGLQVGQITPKPIKNGDFWLILKLDKFDDGSTLKPEERKRAVDELAAFRLAGLLPALRKRYKVTYTTPAEALRKEPAPADTTEVAKITPVNAREGAGETLTFKDLKAHMLEFYGQASLDQLIQRRLVDQEAARLGVKLPDSEVAARTDKLKQQIGDSVFQVALAREGISEAAWRERMRYSYLTEKVLNARMPVKPQELTRMTVRYIRVGTEADAKALLQALNSGTPFELLARQRSLDRGGDGFVQPKIFLRIDNPAVYDAIPATAQPGRPLPKPVQIGGSWLILQPEARFGPDTMTVQERDLAIQRINADRIGGVLETLRKTAKIEYPVPMKTLIADAKG